MTTDVNNDGLSDGARHAQVHTQTTINIYLGKFTSVAVPEYDWLTAGLALIGGAGIVAAVKRRV